MNVHVFFSKYNLGSHILSVSHLKIFVDSNNNVFLYVESGFMDRNHLWQCVAYPESELLYICGTQTTANQTYQCKARYSEVYDKKKWSS